MCIVAAIVLAAPSLLAAAVAVWLLGVIIAAARRLGGRTILLLLLGLLTLAIAAGGPRWRRSIREPITVMVDLSPSTRGASFRSRQWLQRRVGALLGDRRRRWIEFADVNRPLDAGGDVLAEIPSEQTVFTPPADVSAVLLFSDGRFPLPPHTPPVYPVIDPALDSPGDAAVTDLQIQNDQAIATIRSAGSPRELKWTGIAPPRTVPIPGPRVVAAPVAPAVPIVARLSPGDRWPENDALSILPPPPAQLERWWIGRGPAPAGWRQFNLEAWPTDPAEYLNVATIALDDLPGDVLPAPQLRALDRYVRDFGGGLLIVGGSHAFGSAMAHTPLAALSPLAPAPPQPATQWILLIDSSGSMAATIDGSADSPTLWQAETAAARAVIPVLPPADRVSAGSFAGSVRWWWIDAPAADAASKPIPPPGLRPTGPTDLLGALQQGSVRAAGPLPAQLILLTDADAPLPHPAALMATMIHNRFRLNVLALGNGSALPMLRQIASASGGAVVQQLDPRQWRDSATRLARLAWPPLQRRDPAQVHFVGPLAGWADRAAPLPWNRTWLASGATLLATLSASGGAPVAPAAAMWRVGAGQVAAIAFSAPAHLADRLAERIAAEPRDPRFLVSVQSGSTAGITVDAVDGGHYLNDLDVQMRLEDLQPTGGAASAAIGLRQTGPGFYAARFPAPRRPVVAAVTVGGRVIDRLAIAGRYAPEFDAIGNDSANLAALARRSGGRVIEPSERGPIAMAEGERDVPLSSAFAVGGAALVAAAAVRARAGR